MPTRDKILVTGTLGDHGITIMSCREGLGLFRPISKAMRLRSTILSPRSSRRHPLAASAIPRAAASPSTLNELADQADVDMYVDEDSVPVRDAVLGACEMLGYDVMQVANEGKMVAWFPPTKPMRRSRP